MPIFDTYYVTLNVEGNNMDECNAAMVAALDAFFGTRPYDMGMQWMGAIAYDEDGVPTRYGGAVTGNTL